ncbi:MAG: hypothetical protein ACTSU2_01760 [Promethearchaeota archaeon]
MSEITPRMELWEEMPSSIIMPLGRRGQEIIQIDQCFLEGCDNHDFDKLTPFDKTEYNSEVDEDGNYYNCRIYKIKCEVCGRVYQLAYKTIYAVAKKSEEAQPQASISNNEDGHDQEKDLKDSKDSNDKPKAEPFMGLLYVLDEKGENLGFLGFF